MTGSMAAPPSQRPFDGLGEAALVAGDMDLEGLVLWRVVAAIAGIGDDLAEVGAGRALDCRKDGGQRVAVIGIAGQRLDVGDELAAVAALERRGNRDLDAELIGLVGLALADALHLRSVQGVDLPAPLALVPDAAGKRQRQAEDLHQARLPGDLAGDVADHRAQHGAQPLELPVGALESALTGVEGSKSAVCRQNSVTGACGGGRHGAAPAGGEVELVAVFGIAAAFDDDIGMLFEQADQLLAGGHRLTGQHPPLALSDDPLDQRPIMTNLDLPQGYGRCAGHGQTLARLLQIGQGRMGDRDQLAVELDAIGSTARELDLASPPLGCTAVIAPCHAGPPLKTSARFKRRTMTRTASQSRLLSLGSCMSAEVTVLSSRTTAPSSSFACRALDSSTRLIFSQVAGRSAPIVFCSTDFWGLHDNGRRAKARNEAESSRWNASS